MRREWIFGFGAISTLAVLVGIDLLVALAQDRLRPRLTGTWAGAGRART
jgi:hypothetical protein